MISMFIKVVVYPPVRLANGRVNLAWLEFGMVKVQERAVSQPL